MNEGFTEAKKRIILAIDTPSLEGALALCKEVSGSVGLVKLGLEFFLANGTEGVNKVAELGCPIFLDLKLHDIPNTVSKAIISLFSKVKGVEMLTLHASGGEEMLKAANLAAPSGLKLLGVTVLTSKKTVEVVDHAIFPYALGCLRAFKKIKKLRDAGQEVPEEIWVKLNSMVENANHNLMYWLNISKNEHERIAEANKIFATEGLFQGLKLQIKSALGTEKFFHKNIYTGTLNEVLHLAKNCMDSGVNHIVCSAREAKNVKLLLPEIKIIAPGIRPSWFEKKDDQARIATPYEAIQNGADYLVIGRPITESPNPKEALQKTIAEVADAIQNAS